MPIGVGAGAFVGIGLETTPNTYVAPTKYLLCTSESLAYTEDRNERRPLRGIADVAGYIAGPVRVEGDLEIEVTEDQLPWLLRCARGTMAKAGTPDFTYTFTPSHVAIPPKTMSITVVKNGVAFGYVGCVISSMSFTVSDMLLMGSFTILGSDEADQTVPTPTYVTAVPFGAGQYSIEIPTGTPVTDTDTFTFQVEDNAEAQYRLKSTGRGAQFQKYGERSVSLSVERDFESRADYDAYKALTAQSVSVTATKGANNLVTFKMPASVKSEATITGLTSQGDLIRQSLTYGGTYDSVTSKAYEIVVKTQEDVPVS